MDEVTVIGIVASCLSAASSLPQLIKLVKKKQAKDISISMLVVLLVGLVLWITYGIMKGDMVIIISNCVSLLINGLTTFFSIKYKDK